MSTFKSLLYARKQILPSSSASVLQSMNMAGAFAEAGCAVSSYPGLSELSLTTPAKGKKALLNNVLQGYGLQPKDFSHCHPLPAFHKGAYGLAYRFRVARKYMKGMDITFTRDVSDGFLIARLRSLLQQRQGLFLYEMHEALFAMHKTQPKRDWRATKRKEQALLTEVDGIIVINEELIDTARKELGFQGPYLTEPSGFNETLFSPLPLFTPEHPWPDNEQAVRLVYLGNMHESKGVAELIQAMAFLPERFFLHIIGGGSETAVTAMRKLAQTIDKGQERVRFIGHLRQKDLWEACLGSHIAVLPQQPGVPYFSPIKFNEALALGLPLVITPLPVFAQQSDLAHSAPDTTPQGLAAAIMELAALPDKAKTLREQGMAAASRHTWTARAKRILDFAASL